MTFGPGIEKLFSERGLLPHQKEFLNYLMSHKGKVDLSRAYGNLRIGDYKTAFFGPRERRPRIKGKRKPRQNHKKQIRRSFHMDIESIPPKGCLVSTIVIDDLHELRVYDDIPLKLEEKLLSDIRRKFEIFSSSGISNYAFDRPLYPPKTSGV